MQHWKMKLAVVSFGVGGDYNSVLVVVVAVVVLVLYVAVEDALFSLCLESQLHYPKNGLT